MALGHEETRNLRSVAARITKVSHHNVTRHFANVLDRLRRSAPTQTFRELMAARDTASFVVDASGLIQAIRIADHAQLESLCRALVGQSLPQIVGSETYNILAEVCRRSAQLNRSQELGCLLPAASGMQWFRLLIRHLPPHGKRQVLFSIFCRNTGVSECPVRTLTGSDVPSLQVEELAGIGTWDANVDTGLLLTSDRFLPVLSLDSSDSPKIVKLLWGAVESWLGETWRGSPEPIEREIPYLRSDGEARIFQVHALPISSGSRAHLRFRGTLQDVTEQKAVERKLQDRESLLGQAEQIANLGSWECDVATQKVTWSEQLYHLLGRCPWEPVSDQTYLSNLHPGDLVRVRTVIDEAIRDCREYAFVARYRLPTGGYRVHSGRGVAIRGRHGRTARLVGVVQDITGQTKIEEDLHRLTRELMRARDEERRHVARELHESAGQSLAALKMTLGNLREALPKRNSLHNSLLQACVELTNEVVREVRTISYLMHPPMLDESGLASALRWYARGFAERSQIQVEVDVPDNFGRQLQEIEMTVFRVVQEALTNVHRCSGSKVARISLMRNAKEIQAEVQDRGCGLAHPGQNGGHLVGVGIAGMRERVLQLNGSFEIESVPGHGTTIRVVLPIASAPTGPQQSANDPERTTVDALGNSARQYEGDL